MKLLFPRVLTIAAIAVVQFFLTSAQAPAQTPAPVQPSAPTTQSPAPGANGAVIFSRSTDKNGETKTTVGPAAAQNVPALSAEHPRLRTPSASSVAFTALRSRSASADRRRIRSRCALHLTVRNDGKDPLAGIPLQISSSLNWEQIRLAGRTVPFTVAILNSDTDHTGQLHEAAVPLDAPLAPGASTSLDVVYSGTIASSAQRLLTLGTPEALALHSDWDEISPDFTGLRGFGNVVWYPVSTIPVILGDGSLLFDEVGRHKLSLAHTRFRLSLSVEFPHGAPPTIALVNGVAVPLTVADAPGLDADLSGIATGTFDVLANGFLAPSPLCRRAYSAQSAQS